MSIYEYSVTKTISGTIKVDADNAEQGWEKAISGEWIDQDKVEINENDDIMGLSDWQICELLTVDGSDDIF